MSPSDRYWRDLGIAIVLAFLLGEGHAFATRQPTATLTYWTRARLGIEPARPYRHLGVAVLWLFLGWLGAHLTLNRFGVRWDWREESAR